MAPDPGQEMGLVGSDAGLPGVGEPVRSTGGAAWTTAGVPGGKHPGRVAVAGRATRAPGRDREVRHAVHVECPLTVVLV